MIEQHSDPQAEQQEANLGTLIIEHTDDSGTTIDGTCRGDRTAEVLNATGWRWSRTLDSWYIPRSRNVPPKRHTIDRTVEAMKEAGFTVTVTIDATPGDRGALEARRVRDAAARADRLDERAQRHDQAASDHHAAARGIAAGIPLGQPILVGHHSEGRARRDAARMGAHMDASVAHTSAAEQARHAARIAAAATDARNNPVTVANRIDRLTTEVRRAERQLAAVERAQEELKARWLDQAQAEYQEGPAGDLQPQTTVDSRTSAEDSERFARQVGNTEALALRVREQLTSDRADLAHWEAVRARQITDGTATNFGQHNVNVGDRVQVRSHWYEVVRANTKTVTVLGEFGPRTTPWPEVQAHKHTPAEAAAIDQATDHAESLPTQVTGVMGSWAP